MFISTAARFCLRSTEAMLSEAKLYVVLPVIGAADLTGRFACQFSVLSWAAKDPPQLTKRVCLI